MNSFPAGRGVAAILAVGIMTSCAATSPGDGLSPSVSGSTSSPISTDAGLRSTSRSHGTSSESSGIENTLGTASSSDGSGRGSGSSTGSALLARQVQLVLAGDGVRPSCEENDNPISALNGSGPGVWVTTLYSPTAYPWVTVLCLSGFSTSAPIDLTVVAGTYRAHTHVVPVAGSPVQNVAAPHDQEPPRTLFRPGTSLNVYSKNYGGGPIAGPTGVLVSEMWEFTPPPAAQTQIARSQSMTLTATQGSNSVTVEEPMHTPATPAFRVVPLDGPGSRNRLVLHGFPAGQRVPVGLYRRNNSTDPPTAVLLQQVGSVLIPASRVAEFAVPDQIVASHGQGWFCVLPPLTRGQSDCPNVVVWPDYPGKVSPGDMGPVVKQWQKILVAAQLIRESQQNHDGVYGPKMAEAVRSYFDQYVNPDGGLDLGKGAYRLITAHVAP